MTSRLIGHVPDRAGDRLVGADLVWGQEAPRNAQHGHRVRVGVAEKGRVDWLMTYTQAETKLAADQVYDLAGGSQIDVEILAGEVVIVETLTFGAPSQDIESGVVFLRFRRGVEPPGAILVGGDADRSLVRVVEYLSGLGADRYTVRVPLIGGGDAG